MKTLSIRQPWAWLIANGYKDVENRTWRTGYGGPFYIHASKTFDDVGWWWVKDNFPEINLPSPKNFEQGGIVGQAWIYDCVTYYSSKWFTGPHGFLIREAKPRPLFECRGKLRFFEVDV